MLPVSWDAISLTAKRQVRGRRASWSGRRSGRAPSLCQAAERRSAPMPWASFPRVRGRAAAGCASLRSFGLSPSCAPPLAPLGRLPPWGPPRGSCPSAPSASLTRKKRRCRLNLRVPERPGIVVRPVDAAIKEGHRGSRAGIVDASKRLAHDARTMERRRGAPSAARQRLSSCLRGADCTCW
jgi:hypothetical protein